MHGENRIYYTADGGVGIVYQIVVTRGEQAAAFDCREAPGTANQPAACLSIARSARWGTPATARPTPQPPSAAPTPPRDASGSRDLPAPSPAPPTREAAPSGEIFIGREFGNAPAGTSKTIRFVLPCSNPLITRTTPPDRLPEFRIMSPEPAKGRVATSNGRQVPFQCPSGSDCVIPFSFSPKSPIAQVFVQFVCDVGATHMMFGSAR
jgi:hypothetical protein